MATKQAKKAASENAAKNKQSKTLTCSFPLYAPKGTLWELVDGMYPGWRTIYSMVDTVADLREFIEYLINYLEELREAFEEYDENVSLSETSES